MKSKKNSLIVICGGAPHPFLVHVNELMKDYEEHIFIGVDRGAVKLMEAGFEVDYAVGDFDSVTIDERAKIREGAEVMNTFPSAKDDTDFELALSLIIEEKIPGDIYIYGAFGTQDYGRMDHLLSNMWTIYQPRFESLVERVCFIEKKHQLGYLTPGQHEIIPEKWVDYLSVISLTAVENLEIKGAKYELPPTDFAYPRAQISNEFIQNEKVHISFDSGLVLVMYVRERKSMYDETNYRVIP